MTNDIVKQDAQEVQAVSGYEVFREKCAKAAESMPKFSTNGSVPLQDRIAEKIRALPLPEVAHKPAGQMYYIRSSFEGRNVTTFDYCLASDKGIIKTVPVYEIPPDAAVLQKENEQLISALKLIESRISYYASLAEGGAPNIEQWAYTDQSGDIKLIRDLIAKVEGGAA